MINLYPLNPNEPINCENVLSSNNKALNIPKKLYRKLEPFILPCDHSATQKLERIFHCHPQLLTSEWNFENAGFVLVQTHCNSAMVGTHPDLDGLIFKGTKNFSKTKHALKRAKGHAVGQEIIDKCGLTKIGVSKNWVFLTPEEDSIYARIKKLFSQCNFCSQAYQTKDVCDSTKFLIVEEFLHFNKKADRKQMEALCNEQLLDEVETFLIEFGYNDAHEDNCPIVDGKLTFLDLEGYSKNRSKKEKLRFAIYGMENFKYRIPQHLRDYWQAKIESQTKKLVGLSDT